MRFNKSPSSIGVELGADSSSVENGFPRRGGWETAGREERAKPALHGPLKLGAKAEQAIDGVTDLDGDAQVAALCKQPPAKRVEHEVVAPAGHDLTAGARDPP